MGCTYADSTKPRFKIFRNKENSKELQKAKLEFATAGNYLRSIYKVLGIVSISNPEI